MRTIEIIASSIEDVIAIQNTGANRIELIAGFSEGGVTPAHGLIHLAAKYTTIPVMVMIRPRSGNFIYTPYEVDQMIYDIEVVKQEGLHGVVLGTLTADGQIDLKSLEKLLAHCTNLDVTFHRAFTEIKDPFNAIDILAQLGVRRILTGGMEPDYQTGVPEFQQLLAAAGEKIIMMPGGGFRDTNIAQFVKDVPNVKEIHIGTGVRENHGYLAPICPSKIKEMVHLGNL